MSVSGSKSRSSVPVLRHVSEERKTAGAYKDVITGKPDPSKKLTATIGKLSNMVNDGRVPSGKIDEANNILQNVIGHLISQQSKTTQQGGEINDEYYGTYRRPVYNVSKVNKDGVYEYDKQFQLDVQSYIKSISPKSALVELNTLQSLVPFMIADPNCRRLSSPVKYGYADLLRFMGWNYDESYVSMLPTVDGEINPLYAKIEYLFPDTYGNMVLSGMHNDRDSKIILYQLYSKLNKINADYAKNPKKYANKRSKEYAEIITALERIVLRKYDPTYISRNIKGQERPMHQHKMNSFVKDLMLFNSILKRHSGTDPLRHPADTTTMKIVDKHFKN
jgi:hypothetical protein